MSWQCIFDEAANPDSATDCEVCGAPRLYAQIDVESIRTRAAAAVNVEAIRLCGSWTCFNRLCRRENAEDCTACQACGTQRFYTQADVEVIRARATAAAIRARATVDVETIRSRAAADVEALRARTRAEIDAIRVHSPTRPPSRWRLVIMCTVIGLVGILGGWMIAQHQVSQERQQLAQEQQRLQEVQQRFAATQPQLPEERKPPAETKLREALQLPSWETPPPQAPLDKIWLNSIGMEFVFIPAGKFIMGSDDGRPDEKPAHEVRISKPFFLGKFEVTQGQWQAVMGNNPSHFTGDPDLPVENVTQGEMEEFIRKLNAREGSIVYRLPTEAEWEYAARGGTSTAYSFGDDPRQLGEYTWYKGNSGWRTHPVGQKKPNPWGLYDMHGNVFEWVQDWYYAYTSVSVTDPQGLSPVLDTLSSSKARVLRGGNWNSDAWWCQSFSRNLLMFIPSYHSADVGLRLLRIAPAGKD